LMRDKTLSLSGQKAVQLSPQQYASWKNALEPVVTGWEKANPGGDKVVTEFRKLYAEATATK
jgi:hypothetical protein